MASSSKASKPAKAKAVARDHQVSCVAPSWQKHGFPGREFLEQLGLGCLTNIDWSPSESSDAMDLKLDEYFKNYDVNSAESRVEGRVIRLSSEMISRVLQLPSQGKRVDLSRKVEAPDRLNFFKEKAFSVGGKGFSNELANDESQAWIFKLVAEVILLERSDYTGVVILDVISEAFEGQVFDWSECIFEKLRARLPGLKDVCLRGEDISLFPGVYATICWILHFIKRLSEEQAEPGREANREVNADAPPATSDMISYLMAMDNLMHNLREAERTAEAKQSIIEVLTRKLREAEQEAEAKEGSIQALSQELEEAKLQLEEARGVLGEKDKALQACQEKLRKAESRSNQFAITIAKLRSSQNERDRTLKSRLEDLTRFVSESSKKPKVIDRL